jgi:hypothetical protein
MKINSKYNDYFDYLSNIHGIDNKIVFDRFDQAVDTSHIRTPLLRNNGNYPSFTTVPILIGEYIHLYYKINSDETRLYSKNEIVEQILNKPDFIWYKNDIKGHDNFGLPIFKSGNFKNLDKIAKFCNTFGLDTNDITTSYGYGMCFFANEPLKSEKCYEINKYGLSYVSFVEDKLSSLTYSYDIESLPLLKNIKLNLYLDAEYVYQTLYNFLVRKHQEQIDKNSYTETDNNTKIESAGFDKKTSFRGKM